MLISTTFDLENICEKLMAKKPKFIAVDTEFIRNNFTYYPRLSLIQISYEGKSFVIDALVPKIDLSSFKRVMLNREIIKVFHSCRQDIESLFTVFKCIPNPIFDTQIAAMFCHYYHDFIGYSKIVEEYQGIVLNKIKAKNSDWLKRPLSKDQLEYAINDVVHLYELYKILFNKLIKSGKINWFQEEMEIIIIDAEKCLRSAKNAWKRIKFNYESNPRLILTIKAISEWQETLAQRYNINRNKIISNDVISYFLEKNIERVDEILEDLKKKTKVKEEDLLEFINIFYENEKEFLQQDYYITSNNYDKSVLDILSIILENKCKENSISRKLVLSKGELAESISGHINRLFKGWRYEFFGRLVNSFLNEDSSFEISIVRSKMI